MLLVMFLMSSMCFLGSLAAALSASLMSWAACSGLMSSYLSYF